MDSHHLTVGAHLLLWVFPLLLVTVAVTLHLVPTRRREGAP